MREIINMSQIDMEREEVILLSCSPRVQYIVGLSSVGVKLKTIELVFVASLLSTAGEV
jgi:hypothetical protein